MITSLLRLAANLAAVLCLVMMVLISAEVVARQGFGFSFLFVDEISGYLLVWLTFLGVAETYRQNRLLRISFILEAMPAALGHWTNVLFDLICAAFAMVMAYFTLLLVLSSYRRGIVASTLAGTPQYIPQAIIPIGFALLALTAIYRIVTRLRQRGDVNGRLDGPPEHIE